MTNTSLSKIKVFMSLCQCDNCVKIKGSLQKQESPYCSISRALNYEAEISVDEVDRIVSSLGDQET